VSLATLRGAIFLVGCLLLVGLPPAERTLRASALLLRMGDRGPPSGLAAYNVVPFEESRGSW
jgi:hypothetical protein